MIPRAVEGIAAGAAGAALAWPLGRLLDAPLLSAVALGSGALAGWRGIYAWREARGWAAFVLDSTWALPMSAGALFANAVAALQRDPGYVADLSHRQNRHVFARGFMPRKGFAITLGNTICGAGDTTVPRRRRLITDHEDVHCWQARWFGPLYPVLYVGWMVLAGGGSVVVWLLKSPRPKVGKLAESFAYYANPFEWWAYSRDDHWPPSGKLADVGWRRPIVRPLSAARARKEQRRRERSATPGG